VQVFWQQAYGQQEGGYSMYGKEAFPPLPDRPLGQETASHVERCLEEHRERIEASRSRLLDRIIEHLGKTDPDIDNMVMDARRVRKLAAKAFIKPPVIPRTLRREDLPALRPPDSLSEDDLLELVLPRLRVVRVPHNVRYLASSSKGDAISELLKACTEVSWRLESYPNWGDAAFSDPEHGMWLQWTYKPTTAACYAHVIGSGYSQDYYATNEARWHWWFGPDVSEDLDIWLSGRLSGPCNWRGGSDVTVWLLTEAWVEKYIPTTPEKPGHWTDVGHLPRALRLSYSTNDGLDLNGPPPRGQFASDGKSYVPFAPTDGHFRIQAEAGLMHLVTIDVQIALIANYDAAIAIGSIGGDVFDLCELTAYCTVCRCT
jgi:hypothetical protein